MSLVLTRPPPRASSKRGGRKVYTLHSSPNNVFAWNLDNDSMKTATVVFKRHQDAAFMAQMIENHVLLEKEWPDVSVVNNVFKLYGNGKPAHPYENDLIEIRSWDMDKLRVFCVTSYLDMISLNSVTKTDDVFKLNGELLSLSVPSEFHVSTLNLKYYES